MLINLYIIYVYKPKYIFFKNMRLQVFVCYISKTKTRGFL